jgi:hypothetical protein
MNPFEVLELDPTATEEEIVRQAARLKQRATTDAELAAIHQAVQALTSNAAERQLHALMAFPRPGYSTPALDRLVAAHRRAPVSTAPPEPCPPLDLAEFDRLLRTAAAEELDLKPEPFEPIDPVDPDDVRRQAAEAVWQSLVYDPRG